MQILYPFTQEIPITDDFQAHLDRASTAPGLDFAAPLNTPVLAAITGAITRSRYYSSGGRAILIEEPRTDPAQDLVEVYYCHLQSAHALRYEQVTAGQLLATTGNTGTNTTGPHLHMALKIGGQYVDPAPYLSEPTDPVPPPEDDMSILWTQTVKAPGYVQIEAEDEHIMVTGLEPDGAQQYVGLAAAVRQPAFHTQSVPMNDDAALLKFARRKGLGAPITPEYQVDHDGIVFVCQGFAAGIALCPLGLWDAVEMIGW